MMEPLILEWPAEYSVNRTIYGVYHLLLYIIILLKDPDSEYILLFLLKKNEVNTFSVLSLSIF